MASMRSRCTYVVVSGPMTSRGARRAAAVLLVVVGALLAACTSSDGTDDQGPDCGATVDKPGGGRWTCTFVDNFRGKRLDPDKWLIQSTAFTGFRNNQECYGSADKSWSTGSPRSRCGTSGALRLCQDPAVASRRNTPAAWSARSNVSPRRTAGSRSGRGSPLPRSQASRARSGCGRTTPQARRLAASGEIDIAEYYSQYPTGHPVHPLHSAPGDPTSPTTTA